MPNERMQRLLTYLQQDPGNRQLREDAIRLAHDLARWDIARELLDAGLALQPQAGTLRALNGFSYLQASQPADAERELWAALSLGVEPAGIRYNLALAIFLQRRYLEALEHLSAPLLPFELPMVSVLRARCLHHLQRLDEAVAECEAHLKRVGADAEASGLLALLLLDQGRRELARAYATAVVRDLPSQLEARLVLASLQLSAGDVSEARPAFEQLLRDHPRCGRARLSLALIELNEMRLPQAQRESELAVKEMPEHIGSWHVLGWALLLQNQIAAASSAFERALSIDRSFGESHGGIAVIAAFEGRDDDARASIKRALRLDPSSLAARYAQIVLLQRDGSPQQARALFESVLEHPMGASGYSYREALARRLQQLGGSQQTFSQSVPDPAHRA